jgi:hypothetical protein
MSRFTSAHDDRDLQGVIAAVARHANPGAPEACTQRAFDAARAAAGHANCPTARQLCTRLNANRNGSERSWAEWLDVALNKSGNYQARSAAKRGTVKQSPETIRVSAAFALRLARAEGDHHRTQAAYRAWRDERVTSLDARTRPVLPTDRQIRRAFGTWPNAVASVAHDPE